MDDDDYLLIGVLLGVMACTFLVFHGLKTIAAGMEHHDTLVPGLLLGGCSLISGIIGLFVFVKD